MRLAAVPLQVVIPHSRAAADKFSRLLKVGLTKIFPPATFKDAQLRHLTTPFEVSEPEPGDSRSGSYSPAVAAPVRPPSPSSSEHCLLKLLAGGGDWGQPGPGGCRPFPGALFYRQLHGHHTSPV